MVEVATSTLAAVAGSAAVLVLLLLVLLVRAQRRSWPDVRRVASVAARLETPGGGDEGHGDDHDTVSRLERLAEGAVLRASDAEEAVSRLTGTLDGLVHGVAVSDEQGRVVYRNPAAEERAGEAQVGEAMDQALKAAVHGERVSQTLELLGQPRRILTVTGWPLDDGRRTVGAAVTVDDVTESRRIETVRRDFVTNLTSELKTPVGGLGLVAQTIAGEDDPALVRRLAHRLSRESLRVGRVIDDLSELSRLDAQLMPVREAVPVHLLVAQAVEEMRSLAVSGNISVDASQAPPSLAVVGDRRQLVSGLRHLVENAVRYSGDTGRVQVKVAVQGSWVELSVHDQGPGIPAGELERIFECFYRVEGGQGRDSAGVGLGLAIASQVAAGHGGEVTVRSEEGNGSTFTLRIPVSPGAGSIPVRRAG